MKTFDLLLTCARNLTRRKFRTFLTVIGVVIGTASIVVMISLGVGISEAQDEMFRNMGDLTIINVMSHGASADAVLDDSAVEIMQNLPGVLVATPFMRYRPDSGNMMLTAGRGDRYQSWWEIIGVKPEALALLGYEVAEGENLSAPDGRTIQMLFGNRAAYFFEDTRRRHPHNMVDSWPDIHGNMADPFFNPLETPLTLRIIPWEADGRELRFPVEVVGILESGEFEWEKPMSIITDIENLRRIQQEFERANNIRRPRGETVAYEDVRVKVDDIRNISDVESMINGMGFQTFSMGQIREEMQRATGQIQMILGILGGVSMFVAAISITNTMIMSVYERTREIGVMKVLGCLVGNIRAMFLIEAGMIGLIGGIAGIAVSYLISFALNSLGGGMGGMLSGMGGARISIIRPDLVLTGLVFATLIGIISGFLPANRAVKISALEAIRTE